MDKMAKTPSGLDRSGTEPGAERMRVVAHHAVERHGDETPAADENDVAVVLRGSGLRPTRQRLSLGALLFDGEDRHVTAEWLHERARNVGVAVSLATVYNTLHQFVGAGLLREVAVEGSKSYFDTNTSDHHHFFLEGEGRLIDIDSPSIEVTGLPEVPDGHEVTHIDVVVRLRPASSTR